MSLKIKITNYLIHELKLNNNDRRSFNKWKIIIWKNPRENENGSLGLTPLGFELMGKANIHSYLIKFDNLNLTLDNKFVLWLDRNFTFPYYLTKKNISFFSKKPAVELALFEGDLMKYYHSQIKFHQLQFYQT